MEQITEERPICLSLFTGAVAGFDIAAETAGFRVVAQCEYDPKDPKQNAFNRVILQQNWLGVRLYGDIKELSAEILRHDGLLPIDLITGGPPCQPVSVAGQRKGESDDRWLWGEVIRLVGAVKPRWCCFENPPGILSMGIDTVLSDLEGLGYETGQVVIPACAIGATHRRDRVWIVAYSSGKRYERREFQREQVPIGTWIDADGEDRMANTNGTGRAKRYPATVTGDMGHSSGCITTTRTLGKAEPDLGSRIANGAAAWLANPHWAALPGSYQHPYEPPRTTVKKVAWSRQQITALGNSIVWPVAYQILLAIRQQMKMPDNTTSVSAYVPRPKMTKLI